MRESPSEKFASSEMLLVHAKTSHGEQSKSRKVTQLSNVSESYSSKSGSGVVDGVSTMLSQNEWRGNAHASGNEEEARQRTRNDLRSHQHNFMLYGSGGGEVKTFISNGDVAMVAAAQQISHIRHSSENTSSLRVLDTHFKQQQQHRDDEVRYHTESVRIMEKVHGGRATSSMEYDSVMPLSSKSDAEVISELRNCNSLLLSQPLPQSSSSSSACVQSQHRPEALHRDSVNLHSNNSDGSSSPNRIMRASNSAIVVQQQNCQFQVDSENNSVDYYLRRNVCAARQQQPPHAIDVTTLIRETNDANEHGVKCNLVGVNNNSNDNIIDDERNHSVNVNVIECNSFTSGRSNNHVNPKINEITSLAHASAVNNVKIFTSTEKSSNESNDNNNSNPKNDNYTGRKVSKSDNLTTITSAIENLANGSNHHTMMMMMTSDKEKITTLANDASLSSTNKKEKRRRDRRDRRLARTRASGAPFYAIDAAASSEIAPDILHNHLPPPYADIPAQTSMVPSIVSTVPVEDNRYTFTLPLVRR